MFEIDNDFEGREATRYWVLFLLQFLLFTTTSSMVVMFFVKLK